MKAAIKPASFMIHSKNCFRCYVSMAVPRDVSLNQCIKYLQIQHSDYDLAVSIIRSLLNVTGILSTPVWNRTFRIIISASK